MSDYTPTTDEVRAVWTTWNGYGGLINRTGPEPETSEATAVEFDRWLAAHDEQVRADERERIAQAIEKRLRERLGHAEGTKAWAVMIHAARIARTGSGEAT